MPSTTSKNLGQVSAVIKGATPPTNTDVTWLDTSGSSTVKKIWDPIALTWIPYTQAGTVAGDNWGTQVVQTDSTLSGDGTTGNLLKINQQNATTGQVLTWNGNSWAPVSPSAGGLTSVTVSQRLSGNGTSGQPLDIAQQNAQTGQVLIWNGTAWIPGSPTFNGFIRGMIIMWSGDPTQLPTGWNLCDGSNGTPNLKGQFIVGYDPSDGDYNAIGNQGGAKAISLNANQNGAHVHGILDNGHSHGITLGTDSKGGSSGVNVLSTQTLRGPYNTNTAVNQSNISIQISGAGAPHENRPNYYTLAYIMKL